MADIEDVRRLIRADNGLTVVSTTREDGSVQASVVNAGVLEHPLRGRPVLGFVAVGGARKLVNLRRRPRATAVLRAGWRWLAVEGPVDITGPDDPLDGFDAAALPRLLRDVFTAAGGSHDDWDTYDRVMADERRGAVLVTPERVYGNG